MLRLLSVSGVTWVEFSQVANMGAFINDVTQKSHYVTKIRNPYPPPCMTSFMNIPYKVLMLLACAILITSTDLING